MKKFLLSLFDFLNRDFTGRSWERTQEHPYFEKMTYFGDKDQTKCYWEAGLSHDSLENSFTVILIGTPTGPTDKEEAFCRRTISDLDALFESCRSAIEPVFEQWAKKKMPLNWKESFILDGLHVPKDGDLKAPWEVCYFAEPTGHYFIVKFDNGNVKNVAVDG
jgi:hypothetical protein